VGDYQVARIEGCDGRRGLKKVKKPPRNSLGAKKKDRELFSGLQYEKTGENAEKRMTKEAVWTFTEEKLQNRGKGGFLDGLASRGDWNGAGRKRDCLLKSTS